MRTTEGAGLIPPTKTRVRLDDGDLAVARTLAKERSQYRRYNGRPDEWGRGLISTAVLVGFIGEIAFSKWVLRSVGVHLAIDSSLRWAGDGGIDFSLYGYGIQVKTATAIYDELLIRCPDMADPAWNIVVRVQWPTRKEEPSGGLFEAGPMRDKFNVDLCGWAWELNFRRHSKIEKAYRGDHMNYALYPERLQGMNDLAALLNAKRISGAVA